MSKSNWFSLNYATRLALKNSRHFFIQSEVKPKPNVTRCHALSRALRQLHVITRSFDWFIGLSVPFVIGWSGCFGFMKRHKPYSYSRCWTGTNLLLMLMRRVFFNANNHMTFHCTLLPFQYWEYKYGLLKTSLPQLFILFYYIHFEITGYPCNLICS